MITVYNFQDKVVNKGVVNSMVQIGLQLLNVVFGKANILRTRKMTVKPWMEKSNWQEGEEMQCERMEARTELRAQDTSDCHVRRESLSF